MKRNSNINGIIVVNKEAGYTSRDVVNKISYILGTKKVGHTGTLDPLATGVLVVTVGKYTKLNDALMSTYKEYEAEFKLGILTDTLDIEGTTLDTKKVNIDQKKIKEVILSFKGKYTQEVPKYSAVKVDGKRLYEYARKDIEVDLPKREVEIKEIEVLNICEDTVNIKCTVSKGTYIRSLIRDIGESLGTYATMTKLTRTKQGKFNIDSSYTIIDIEKGDYKLLSIIDTIDNIKLIELNEDLISKVENGVPLKMSYDEKYLLFRYNSNDIALYKKGIDTYKMFIKL